MAGGKKHQSDPANDNSQKLSQRMEKVVKNIERIKQSVVNKTISFNPFEIDCRLEILKDYINQAMEVQSELDVLNPDNEDRSALEDLCVSTKSLLLSLQANIEDGVCQNLLLCKLINLGFQICGSLNLMENILITKIL